MVLIISKLVLLESLEQRKQASNKTDNLPNLSILLSSGIERNIDYHSIGEKSGKSPNLKSLELWFQRIVV